MPPPAVDRESEFNATKGIVMYVTVGLVTLSVVGLIALGIYFEMKPSGSARPGWLKPLLGGNLVVFGLGIAGTLLFGAQEVLAAAPAGAEGAARDLSGLGLALIGIGLPTGLATIGAGLAVGPVGAAALAVIAEKPEMFGRTLIYLGLAEGIAIYGLVVTILLLGKI
jgi:V/A-type H+-transporting ATPase subunit K